jgi:hypothetical protein
VVGEVAVGVRTNVAVQQPDFAGFNETVRIFEVYPAIAGRLDLRPRQDHSCFQPFEYLVVMEGLTIDSDLFVHLLNHARSRAEVTRSLRLRRNWRWCRREPDRGRSTSVAAGTGLDGPFSGLPAPIAGGNCPGTIPPPGFALAGWAGVTAGGFPKGPCCGAG